MSRRNLGLRVRPAGPGADASAVLVAAIALGALAGAIVWIPASSAGIALIFLAPSLLVILIELRIVVRVARGFVLTREGIRGAAKFPGLLHWADVIGLRWGQNPRWGRGRHQLMADLRNGRTVIVWGCRGVASHDRIVRGLIEADARRLLPVERSFDLFAPHEAVLTTV